MSTQERDGLAGEMCKKGLWPEVLAFAQKWQEQNPRDHRALFYIGLGLSGMGQPAQAEKAYRQALKMEPTDFEVWDHLSDLLYKNMHRPAEGIRCLKQALKLYPQHTLGWLHLATMADEMGIHHQALEYADQAIALDSKLVEAYLHKAAAARALGRMDVVKDICHQLATMAPEHFQRAP